MILRFYSEVKEAPRIGRRIAWCVRTILIAISAENKKPVFSSKALSNSMPYFDIEILIELKENENVTTELLSELQRLLQYLKMEPPLAESQNLGDYKMFFIMSQNTMALSFLKSMDFQDNSTTPYFLNAEPD